jgi:3',5'-cyclic AMP phosphodiesterase CpdA
MPQHFIQLSDPHLSSLEDVRPAELFSKRALGYLSWRRKRRFEHRREVLVAMQEDLQNRAAEQILVTGDLTHIGLPSEFAQAADWLNQMGPATEIAVIPGNHDACVALDPARGLDLWRDYLASDPGGPAGFPSLRVRGDLAFIGLSTACPTPPLMASGTLGEAQLRRLEGLLDAQRDRFRVLFLHHSPVAGTEQWRKRLTDAAALRRVLQQRGVELVLHGHGHRARWESLPVAGGEAPVIAVPSASGLGLHGADPAAYNCYTVSPVSHGWQLTVQTRCYEPASEGFTQGETRQFAIAR